MTAMIWTYHGPTLYLRYVLRDMNVIVVKHVSYGLMLSSDTHNVYAYGQLWLRLMLVL